MCLSNELYDSLFDSGWKAALYYCITFILGLVVYMPLLIYNRDIGANWTETGRLICYKVQYIP